VSLEARDLATHRRMRAQFVAAWACSALWGTSFRVAYDRLFGKDASVEIFEWRLNDDLRAAMIVCIWLCDRGETT
jgi:hypothetical protein